ncbi:hypothetical protein ACIGNX_00830 [Actinosynnema sp. NPDC053489]|uniref:hypothetical protein n=1 Tax=Actinosynnema sp. NPDC053489 TaxID=3363916 RepID=UPI0037C62EFA
MVLASPPSTAYAAEVDRLAQSLRRGLDATGRPDHSLLAEHVRRAADDKAALAAVRVLGPDAFAPALLAGTRPHPLDHQVVAEALRLFPATAQDPVEALCLAQAQGLLVARWSTNGLGGPRPGVEAQAVCAAQAHADWGEWSRRMVWLSPLAWPTVPGPVTDLALARVGDLERGLVRAMLRRDQPTAARLARWVAFGQARGADTALELEPVLRHLTQLTGGGARVLLDIEIARRLVAPEERTG